MSQANFLLTTLECCLSSGLLKFAQPRYVDKKIETGIGVPRFEAVPSNRVTQITGLCDGSHRARLPQSGSLILANQRPSPERFSMARGEERRRREFLRTCLAGTLLLGGPRTAKDNCGGAPRGKSRVVIARDPTLRGAGTSIDSGRLLRMLDRAVQSFYGCDSATEAWRRVVRPGEVVGLKVNCLAGRGASTGVPLVEVLCERLQQAGIREKHIVIWDRLNSDLESAGFRVGWRQHIRCIGNDSAGYEDDLAVYGSVGSLLSKTLTRACDAVINLPVLKDHGITGVTLALKNFFGAIHNPNKYHVNSGDPYVADVNMLTPIRQKLRLSICDATTAQYEGGPSFMPQWTWPFNGLIVARDSVALDYTGWGIIEQKRAEKGLLSLRTLKREPAYIATAAGPPYSLGTDDPNQIERVEA